MPDTPRARTAGQSATERAKAELTKATAAAEAAPAEGGSPARQPTIMEVLQDPKQQEQIAAALPGAMTVERFTRICLTAIRANPQLAQCSQASLIAACMQSAQLGLEPGILGQSYLVPFFNNKKRVHEVQFIIGYQGYIDLFYRSGQVTSVVAREVREKDHFKFHFGIEDVFEHTPAEKERGDIVRLYGLARLTNGDHILHVMNLEEIYERKNRSRAADQGPWVTDAAAMARKTVIRAMVPFVPKTVDLREAMAADESVPTVFHQNMAEQLSAQPIIDVELPEPPTAEEPPADEPPADSNGEATPSDDGDPGSSE